MARRTRYIVSALVAMAVASGCLGFLGGESETAVRISVENDVSPAAPLTIELQSGQLPPVTLGTVEPGDDETFTYEAERYDGNYQLVAQQPSGSAVVSRRFTLFSGAEVEWYVRSNSLSVLEGG